MAHVFIKQSVPPNTTIPVRVDANLSEDVLTGIEVRFPRGCAGLCGVRIETVTGLGVFPQSPGYLRGDGNTIRLSANMRIQANSRLVVLIVNEDDTYPHAPEVSIISAPYYKDEGRRLYW